MLDDDLGAETCCPQSTPPSEWRDTTWNTAILLKGEIFLFLFFIFFVKVLAHSVFILKVSVSFIWRLDCRFK